LVAGLSNATLWQTLGPLAVWVAHRDFRCSPFEMASLGPLFCIVRNGIDNTIISKVEPTPKRRVIAPRSGLSWQMKQANTIKARAAGSGLGFFHFRVCCC
jgi:hypothetical protein